MSFEGKKIGQKLRAKRATYETESHTWEFYSQLLPLFLDFTEARHLILTITGVRQTS